jgi:hypothetical protein
MPEHVQEALQALKVERDGRSGISHVRLLTGAFSVSMGS